MPKILPTQNDFTAGILTPRMHSRTDVEGYARGVADCVNLVTLKQGPLQKRVGTRYIDTLSGDIHRLFEMQMFADNQIGEAFAVLVDDTNLNVIGATGLVSGKEIVVNPSFAGGLSPWTSFATGSASVSWTSGGAVLAAGQTSTPASQYAEVRQQVAITVGKENEPHQISASKLLQGRGVGMSIEIRVGTAIGDNSLYSSIADGSFNPNGNSSVWITLRAYSNSLDEIGTGGEPTIFYDNKVTATAGSIVETGSSEIKFAHGWSQDEINKIRTSQNPELETLYFATGDSAPRQLEYDPVNNEWSFSPIGFTAAPAEWTDAEGWPSVFTFYQGRSFWSGHKKYPNRIWASKSKTSSTDYFNMTLGTLDDDAMDTTISKRGKVSWMEPLGNTLIVGTTDAEFASVSEGRILTPSDIGFEEQSNNGGGYAQPTKAGNFVLYSSFDRRKLFSLIYRWTENAWRSRDMTFTAEHLTAGSGISSIAYTKNPENIVWIITANSELIACTFDPSTELLGWHRHDLGGDVVDFCAVETKGTSALFVVVKRELNGQIVTLLEHLDFSDSAYMDSYVRLSDTTFVSVPHLANETVAAVVDGAVVPPIVLDSNGDGEIQSDVTPSEVVVGLPFEATVLTLPAAFGYPNGSMVTLPVRWNKIYTYLTDSALPLVEGQRARDRSYASLMDFPEPLTTGISYVSNVGYDRLGQIRVTSDIPLAFTLNGILGELNASNV